MDQRVSARIERWVLRLQPYNFRVMYKPEKYNLRTHCLVVLATAERETQFDEYIKFVVCQVAITRREIEQISRNDSELQRVRDAVLRGDQSAVPTDYKHVWDELTTVGHVVRRGCRIVAPQDFERERWIRLTRAIKKYPSAKSD